MSALMTLFFKILRDPLDKESQNDATLIISVAILAKNVSSRQRWPQDDVKRIEELNQFIEELHRLAYCAIAKAQRKS